MQAPNWLAALLGLTSPPAPQVDGATDDSRGVRRRPWPRRRPRTGAGDRPEPIIEANDISVQFGGVRAVDGVWLALHEDEILGLIGPNGSGKTDVPQRAHRRRRRRPGRAAIDGDAVRLGRPGHVRRAGMLRAYQTPQTYLELSCIENVLLSTADRRFTGIMSAWFAAAADAAPRARPLGRPRRALERVGLLDLAEDSAARLSYGQRRLLELARAIGGDPTRDARRAVGRSERGRDRRARGAPPVAARRGIALLLVDHKIDFISSLCDRVAVLELGPQGRRGRPGAIWADERVDRRLPRGGRRR